MGLPALQSARKYPSMTCPLVVVDWLRWQPDVWGETEGFPLLGPLSLVGPLFWIGGGVRFHALAIMILG